MGILPSITNATLTSVAAAGFQPDYDQEETAGVSKWAGSEPVLWNEEIESLPTGAGFDVFLRRSMVVDADLGVPWAVDDVVTVVYGGGPQTGVIRAIQTTRGTGLPSVTRLEFRAE